MHELTILQLARLLQHKAEARAGRPFSEGDFLPAPRYYEEAKKKHAAHKAKST